mmetsp:Transcript_8658/g.13777  ORF Transcript_8658/g.13777 Transcript_8658/m.13777 type:complete len:224 (-) Transcript_8658:314-985(-)
MPDRVRDANRDLVAKALEYVSEEDLDEILELFVEEDWENHDILRAWLVKGGDIDDWNFPDEFAVDKELMLLVAEHNESLFHHASSELLQDKNFLLQALEKNGMVYRDINCGVLRQDFDILLSSWGRCKEVGDIFFAREEYRLVATFAEEVRELLCAHDIFFKTVLCGTSVSRQNSPLRNLLEEQGIETSLAFRKQLAELLDIPTGVKLTKLRRASKHLEFWGY